MRVDGADVTTVGEAVSVSCEGVFAGATVNEAAGGAGDGEFRGKNAGKAVGDAVGPWARPSMKGEEVDSV